ncbi:MAG: DNA methyltransferase [Bacillota bacterium]
MLLLTFSLASLFTGCAVTVTSGGEAQVKSGEKKTGEQEAAPNVAPEQGDKKTVYHENMAGPPEDEFSGLVYQGYLLPFVRENEWGWNIAQLSRELGRRGGWLLDLLPSGKMDKRYHEWQQSLTPVKYLIEKLTMPGDLVADPCFGTGTVGVACRLLGRRFVGAEKDPETAAMARERIARAEEEAQLAEVGS